MLAESFNERPFVFRLNDSGVGPLLLSQVCKYRTIQSENLKTEKKS